MLCWKSTNSQMVEPAWEAHPPSNYPMLGPTPGPGFGSRQLFAALWDLLQLGGHQSGPRTRPWCLPADICTGRAPRTPAAAFQREGSSTLLALLLLLLRCTEQHFATLLERSSTGTDSTCCRPELKDEPPCFLLILSFLIISI